jgi:hypothetical protein
MVALQLSAGCGTLPGVALKEAMRKPVKPPNLRHGTARARCGLCRHYDGKSHCRLYRFPVRANDVSDSYSSAAAPMRR